MVLVLNIYIELLRGNPYGYHESIWRTYVRTIDSTLPIIMTAHSRDSLPINLNNHPPS